MSLISKLLGGGTATIEPRAYHEHYVQAGVQHALFDVRTPEEFAQGHIPGARNIDVQSLPGRLNEIPRDRPVIVYCRTGNRSGIAAGILARAGYKQVANLGGIGDWAASGLPVQRRAA